MACLESIYPLIIDYRFKCGLCLNKDVENLSGGDSDARIKVCEMDWTIYKVKILLSWVQLLIMTFSCACARPKSSN